MAAEKKEIIPINIYDKIQCARVDLQESKIKKSGKNTYSNYDYFQLSDFLPALNIIMRDRKLFSSIEFTEKEAILTILNTEQTDETVKFVSPMADVTLKGAHAIQNIGAIQTYQRRYLYMLAFEIAEDDAIDSQPPKENKAQPPKQEHKQSAPTKVTEDQRKRIGAIAKELSLSSEDMKGIMIMKYKIDSSHNLTNTQAGEMIRGLKQFSEEYMTQSSSAEDDKVLDAAIGGK